MSREPIGLGDALTKAGWLTLVPQSRSASSIVVAEKRSVWSLKPTRSETLNGVRVAVREIRTV